MKRFFLLIILWGTALSLFAKPIILHNMVTQNFSHDMRTTLYLSSATQYRLFVLSHPDRFVLDLKNVKTFRRLILQTHNNAMISGFKYALHHDGILRLVFVLHSGVIARVIKLPPVSHQPRLQIIFSRKEKKSRISWSLQTQKYTHPVVINEPNIKRYRDVIVVIDPGHGGKDPGATGIGGTKEKNVVLSISKKLQQWIDSQPGYKAMLTRKGDYYLTLRQRLQIARKDHADMFIAIHADKWRNTKARGVSVFALSQRGATSEAARWLATRENASELMGGVHLNDKSHMLKSVLINLSQSATIRSSLEMGGDILQKVKPIARLHHDRVEQAAFVVLKSPDIPSLLVETGFLSNPHEERRLRSMAYQNELAESLMRGITEYFAHYSPRGTWLSYWRQHPNKKIA